MNSLRLPAWLAGFNSRALAAPIIIIMMLSMMVLPLPAFVLDIFFSFNIALAVIVLLTSLYTVKPLDFMAFPTVLLVSTMLRLSLNVASTRVVLTEGHTGPDAAGKVIEAFGHFLIGGNYTVGIVVFIILTIINFTVVTKGAGRIAEVGARFALDAMPGKQMAIDADLNAGLIGEQDARRRRTEVAQEAEFYGAMDGASKYVRGDAVAASSLPSSISSAAWWWAYCNMTWNSPPPSRTTPCSPSATAWWRKFHRSSFPPRPAWWFPAWPASRISAAS
jgi:flagellar biosynthesis protein FlhA